MRKQKKTRLEEKGWKVGSVKEFLGPSNEESAYLELKFKLARGLCPEADVPRISFRLPLLRLR